MRQKILEIKERIKNIWYIWILFRWAKHYDHLPLESSGSGAGRLQQEVMSKARTLYRDPAFVGMMEGVLAKVMERKARAIFQSKLTGEELDLFEEDDYLLSLYMYIAIAGSRTMDLDSIDPKYQRGFCQIRAMAYTLDRNMLKQGYIVDPDSLTRIPEVYSLLCSETKKLVSSGTRFVMLLIAYEYGVFNPYRDEIIFKQPE